MTERIPCVNEGCDSAILPVTAEANEGLCGPCLIAKQREERLDYIRKNRVDIDLYQGVSDPVEIVCIMQSKRKYDPLKNYLLYPKSVEEMYNALSADELLRLVDKVIEFLHSGQKVLAEDVSTSLACMTSIDMGEIQQTFLDVNEAYPDVIFRGADDEVCRRLIESTEDESSLLSRNHVLCALACTGNKMAEEQFREWKFNPPAWKEQHYIPVDMYSEYGGWNITDKGKRRDLFYRLAYPLLKSTGAETKTTVINVESEKQCPSCGEALNIFFDFDLTDSAFDFLGISGKRLRVSGCEQAACYGNCYMDVDFDGSFSWNQANEPECDATIEWGDRNTSNMTIGHEEPYWRAANEFLPTTFSQVGGLPMWQQDAAYPCCPKCSNKMKFIAQVDNSEIQEYSEGIFYTYLCEPCLITAVNYQQT